MFTNGVFDILHSGHSSLFETARSFGDLLVVGMNTDESVRELKGDTRPFIRLEDRMFLVASLEAVDFVVEFSEAKPLKLIERVRPDVHVKGGDYEIDELPETALVRSFGGDVRIVPHVRGLSSTKIANRAHEALSGGSEQA